MPNGSARGFASRIPPGTAIIIAVAVFAAAVQEVRPDWLALAGRNPARLAAGEWWRVVTALFAYDGGPVQKLGTVFAALAIGLAVERRFGTAEWLIIAFVSGLAGQVAGLWWQPVGAGPSVAVAGLLGAVGAWLAAPLMGNDRLPVRAPKAVAAVAPVGAAALVVLAIGLVVLRDPHGPAILAGAAIGALFLWRPAG